MGRRRARLDDREGTTRSTVVTARLPQELFDAIEQYRIPLGLQMADAVRELLHLGLGASPSMLAVAAERNIGRVHVARYTAVAVQRALREIADDVNRTFSTADALTAATQIASTVRAE